MKQLLKSAQDATRFWTLRASRLAAYAAGLSTAVLVLQAVQFPERWKVLMQGLGIQPAEPAHLRTEHQPMNSESMSVIEELAKIEADARRERASWKAPSTQPAMTLDSASAPAGNPSTAPPATRGSTKLPRIAHQVEPIYPRFAKAAQFQGPVEVTLRINDRGYPTKVLSVQGNSMLQQAALEAAQQWRFHPAQVDGKAVPSEFKIRFEFRLV